MSGRGNRIFVHWRFIGAFVAVLALSLPQASAQAEKLVILHPEAWHDAATNFVAFKTGLGFEVEQVTAESLAGTGTLTSAGIRNYLHTLCTTSTCGPVSMLVIGDFDVIPAPPFKVVPAGRPYPDATTYRSDVYYRDLSTEFDRDGDGIFGEFDTTGGTQDFDNASFDGVFVAMRTDVGVGRIPLPASSTVAEVRTILDRLVAFERDTRPYKKNSILSAGRINTSPLLPADSWDYVVKGMAAELRAGYPEHQFTSIVHASPGYSPLDGIDYLVEGTNINTDYPAGQALVRGIVNSNDNISFVCTVSHGSPQSDFSLTCSGAGLPNNNNPFIGMSMSCSSFDLGRVAMTSGSAVAWLGSVAVVEADVSTLYSGTNMVSGDIQRYAFRWIACDNVPLGAAFEAAVSMYIQQIRTRAATFYASYKPETLRNIVGFNLVGDPTMAHNRPDSDGDSLLDAEEVVLGTATNMADTDMDDLPDGYEAQRPELDPLVHNGLDVDLDDCPNAGELLAGTDPVNPNEYPALVVAGPCAEMPETTFAIPTVTGRTYRIDGTPTLASPAWTNVTASIAGTGSNESFVVGKTDPAAFYRLVISVP